MRDAVGGMRRAWLAVVILTVTGSVQAWAQGNYEIQVYGSETVPPKTLMTELHSNYTIDGQQKTIDGIIPTNHQVHETLELTQGINDWAEVGFYVFSSIQSGYGWQWVGDHIRPRVRAPDSWHLPVGLSLSTEIGYQRAQYSLDTWTWEIRPIVDKAVGRWYFAVNPALERTLHGPDVNQGWQFAPAVKVSYDFTKVVSGGVEYYGDYGMIPQFDSLRNQQQQIFVVTDLNVSPVWEINFGVGVGPTASTDHLIVKGIVGRRFSWGKRRVTD
jgi:hypothetical protein